MTNKTKKQMNKAQMKKAKGGILVVDTSDGVADHEKPAMNHVRRKAGVGIPNGIIMPSIPGVPFVNTISNPGC